MAYATGGDTVEITVNHPTLGSKSFKPKAGEDSTFDLGGPRTNDDDAQVTGDGQKIRQINNRGWSWEGVIAWDQQTANELDFLTQLSGHPVEGDYTISHISGAVYRAKGSPVGDPQGNANAGTIDLKLAGGDRMRKISG
jgi:hypothetical protein